MLSKSIISWLLIGLTVSLFACSENDTSGRGPYLQNASSTTMVVKWRSNQNALGQVNYGINPNELTEVAFATRESRDQEVLLTTLVADTDYYYKVSEDDAEYTFRSPPVEGSAMPTRVWILGDSGTANLNASLVKLAFYDFNGGPVTDLMLTLGDNAYDIGTDSNYQQAFFNMYKESLPGTLVWPAIGNHDVTDGELPYFDIFTLPTDGKTGVVASGTEAYYSFNYANIHFVSLDSELSSLSSTGAMYNWLITDLTANTQDWTVVYFHRPPYSKGSHDSDLTNSRMAKLRENFVPVFEMFGVDLVFSGHSHAYERSYPILGHYGTSDTFLEVMKSDSGDGRLDGDGDYRKAYGDNSYGAIYTVAGSSGKSGGGALNHSAHYISMDELGSVVLDFDGDVVDVTFVSPNPDAVDYYRVTKF
jgi:hypothetical protein